MSRFSCVAIAAPVEEKVAEPTPAEAPASEESAAAVTVDAVVEDKASAPNGGCRVLGHDTTSSLYAKSTADG